MSVVLARSGPAAAAVGSIEPGPLKELWFHTGTACNLACPFCLEGSKPGDNRLERISLTDAMPWLDEAVAMGVRQFSFTGGEPFVVRDIIRILDYALGLAPCLVLSNGTDPVLQRLDAIESLAGRPHPLSFRISIDYGREGRHDAGRDEGSWRKAWQCLAELHRRGFPVSIARQRESGEDTAAVDLQFRELCLAHGLPGGTRIVSFPDFLTPGAHPDVPLVSEHCMTAYQTADSRSQFMCHFSKMVVKKHGRMRVYACTLVDDDESFDLGGSLHEAAGVRVMLRHHRCYSCFAHGSSCSEINPG